jgi:hypothetical protein
VSAGLTRVVFKESHDEVQACYKELGALVRGGQGRHERFATGLVRRPREALKVGIGEVRAAAELGQEDGQLCCRETQLVEIVEILSLTPNSRNPRSEHLLLVGGERARDVLARAAGLAFVLVNASPKLGFPVLGPKLAGEVGHRREERWLVVIRITSVIVRPRWARQLQAKLSKVIVMHADDAGLGHELLMPGAEGLVVLA